MHARLHVRLCSSQAERATLVASPAAGSAFYLLQEHAALSMPKFPYVGKDTLTWVGAVRTLRSPCATSACVVHRAARAARALGRERGYVCVMR